MNTHTFSLSQRQMHLLQAMIILLNCPQVDFIWQLKWQPEEKYSQSYINIHYRNGQTLWKILQATMGNTHLSTHIHSIGYPDSKVHVAHMGPTWVLSAPGGPHVGPMNLAIRVVWYRNVSVKQARQNTTLTQHSCSTSISHYPLRSTTCIIFTCTVPAL